MKRRGSRRRAAATASAPRVRPVPLACLVIFALVWVVCAIAPYDRTDWLLENALTIALVPAAIVGYWRRPLSDTAYVEATIFLILHTVGSHYTYSEVPAGDWVRDALGLQRNHYDRLVHFSFGLLLLRPLSETVLREPQRMGRLAVALLSLSLVLAASASYELIEWAVAAVADPAAGTAYLGTQGDEWDAQKDMALAALGGVIAVFLPPWPGRRPKVMSRARRMRGGRHARPST